MNLNLGCGSVRPKDWTNTDSSLNANLQRLPFFGKRLSRLFSKIEYSDSNIVYMNLNKPWKYKDNSIDVVYASHLFGHLNLRAADLFLAEAKRTLKPNGVIRVVVPDLYKICKAYINQYETDDGEDPTKFIMWAINMHREGQYKNIGILKKIVLECQGYPHQHKFMYDEKSLRLKLTAAGFSKIESMTYGKSKYINNISDVEGAKEAYLSVYLEARKP